MTKSEAAVDAKRPHFLSAINEQASFSAKYEHTCLCYFAFDKTHKQRENPFALEEAASQKNQHRLLAKSITLGGSQARNSVSFYFHLYNG